MARRPKTRLSHEGVEVDLSVNGEPITGMGNIEGAFRIFGLPLQLSQDCLSDLLFHAVLPLTRGGKSASPTRS